MSGRRPEPSEVAVHEFVQLLAGWVPDGELAAVRRTLADGQPATAAASAVALAATHDVPLSAEDIKAARSLAAEPGPFDDKKPVKQSPVLPFWFSALDPDGRSEADDLDRLLAQAAQEHAEQIAGLWRTWRYRRDDDSSLAFRVYLVQIRDGAVAPAIAGALQSAVDGQGEAAVEVIALDAAPHPYQAQALDGSALVWAAGDEEAPADDSGPPFKIARVFDFAKAETGPGFHPEHRVVTDSVERDRLLKYLTSGTPVLSTTARAQDVLQPDAGPVVPGSFLTDGEWIWTDAVAYYLRQHGLAPDEELAAHISARIAAGQSTAQAEPETTAHAASFLLHPPPEHARKAAWTAGAGG